MKHFLKKFILISIFYFIISLPLFAITVEKEVEIGKEASMRLEKEYGVITDPRYYDRLQEIASLLLTVCPRKDITYTFKVLEIDDINALAFPGGFVYVTKGLMDNCTDGEIAFVIAHELGHIVNRHSIKIFEKETTSFLLSLAIALVVNKGEINEGTRNTLALVNIITSSQYSQAAEFEADTCGVEYIAEAGIDPNYSILVFNKFKEMKSVIPNFLNTFVGSHPLPDQRLNNARSIISKLNYTPNTSLNIPPADMVNAEIPLPEITINKIDYSGISLSGLQSGEYLTQVENSIYDFTNKELDTCLIITPELTKDARYAVNYMVESSKSPKRLVYTALVNTKEGLETFKGQYFNEFLKPIKNFETKYENIGIAVEKTSNSMYHIVIILE